jgi:nucleotide-binding universal stress UspA family protein
MKYVLATDGSRDSLKAAAWAAKNATTDTEIFLVYVFPLPPDLETFEHLVPLPRDADERVCAVARPALDRTRDVLGQVEATVHEVVLVGNPAEEIVNFAASQRADLVITGNRGHGATKELYLGSVSGAVAHRALSSVLVVR